MAISNLFQSERISNLPSLTQPALERAQNDFTQQIQSALKALGADAPATRETLMPALAQVSSAVDSVFEQLQMNLAGNSAPTGPVMTATNAAQTIPPTPISSVKASDASSRNYLLPGEPGAGLPANYRHSPLYVEWLAQKPSREVSGANFSQDLSAWQKANPYYIDPDNYESFDAYLDAVRVSTASGNTAAEADPARFSSFLTSYYGSAVSANPWGNRLGSIQPQHMTDWPEGLREQYEKSLAAQRSAQSLEETGLLGNRGS